VLPHFSLTKSMFKSIHHIAIICSDYPKSKHFYTEILGLETIKEVYRKEKPKKNKIFPKSRK